MMRCATLMPSPMMFGWPLMSLIRRTGPRLMPKRTRSGGPPSDWLAIESRIDSATNIASSGSPRKLTAAPSPVSRMMRSSTATPEIASDSVVLNCSLSLSCSVTERLEYSTMSRNRTLQMKVRLVLSAIALVSCPPARIPPTRARRVGRACTRFYPGPSFERQRKGVEYQSIVNRLPVRRNLTRHGRHSGTNSRSVERSRRPEYGQGLRVHQVRPQHPDRERLGRRRRRARLPRPDAARADPEAGLLAPEGGPGRRV